MVIHEIRRYVIYRMNRSLVLTQFHSREEFDSFIASDRLVVILTFAEWDGPCKDIAPLVFSLSEEHEDVDFVKFDVGKAPDLALGLGVMSMPTFFFFKGGEFIDKVVSADPPALEESIRMNK